MPLKVCLSTTGTLLYPQGGHLWVYINWALGLRSCGCDVTWLDIVSPALSLDELSGRYEHLCKILRPFGLDAKVVVDFLSSEDLTDRLHQRAIPCIEGLAPFDLLVDIRYDLPARLFSNFRRKVLINIDPGQYELWLARGVYPEPKHDLLFSISETASKRWLYTPPCVFLDEWPFTPGSKDAPWTTVAHWWGDWMIDENGKPFEDSKREGFRAFMTIPSKVHARFELALDVEQKAEQDLIEAYGFKVHNAHKLASSLLDYKSFIQNSAGEFSCAKPSYTKLRTAWVSDRTLCYLATGRPCVVQNTGPSRFLPSNKGLHRFSDMNDAVKAIRTVAGNYETESRAARSLAEEFFDAHKICNSLLSRAL